MERVNLPIYSLQFCCAATISITAHSLLERSSVTIQKHLGEVTSTIMHFCIRRWQKLHSTQMQTKVCITSSTEEVKHLFHLQCITLCTRNRATAWLARKALPHFHNALEYQLNVPSSWQRKQWHQSLTSASADAWVFLASFSASAACLPPSDGCKILSPTAWTLALALSNCIQAWKIQNQKQATKSE